jgi:hypothetical protein
MEPESLPSELSVLDEIRGSCESFSATRPRERAKLTGALAMEVIRRWLREGGISVSARDVYILGNPTEFDLLAVRRDSVPRHGIIYDPADVAVVLEIKFSGVFSKDAAQDLRKRFEKVKADHPHIQCVYLTVQENEKFKSKVTEAELGFPVFTLNWVDYRDRIVKPGDSLQRVVECLKNAFLQLPVAATSVGTGR